MNHENQKFITDFVATLPNFEDIRSCEDHFWKLMEVNAERVRKQMAATSYFQDRLPVLGPTGLQLISKWIGIDVNQIDDPQEVVSVVAEHFVLPSHTVSYETILLLSEFLYRRQTLPIETISQVLLDAETFKLIFESDTDYWSKRFCYTIKVFLQKCDNLRLLLLFENGERVGYVRCTLTPIAERHGQPFKDEDVQRVEARIKEGADLNRITPGFVNGVLEDFESGYEQRHSRCFGVIDEADNTKIVFILREWREAIVRQVEDVVFANEAELIVLRLKNKGKRLEEHGNSIVSRGVAAAILGELFKEKDVQYLKDTNITAKKKLDDLLKKHLMADVDDQLRLQELYLYDSKVAQSPLLMLRCGKKETLTQPIKDLRDRGVDLLAELKDIRHIKIAYVINSGTKFEKSYIFRIFLKVQKSGDFFLPYSVANVPTRTRADFEDHLWSKYNVRVIPGTG